MKEKQMDILFGTEKENVKLPSWIQWMGATTIGYTLGMTLSTYLVSSIVRPLGPVFWGLLNVLIYGAVIGISLGVIQFLAMPLKLAPFRWWILGTLAGSAVGFAVASVVSEMLSNVEDPAKNIVLGYGVIALIAGGIIGSANGLGQWLVLQRRQLRLQGWIMASILGTMLGTIIATALLGLLELPLLSAAPGPVVGAILGILAGIFQGYIFWSHRRQNSK